MVSVGENTALATVPGPLRHIGLEVTVEILLLALRKIGPQIALSERKEKDQCVTVNSAKSANIISSRPSPFATDTILPSAAIMQVPPFWK